MHLKTLYGLDGRVAIVTGGSGLYGAAITEGLCEMGARVVVASRNAARCEDFAATLREKGYDACGMALDLSQDASIERLCQDVKARFSQLDILVNNAVDRRNLASLENATRQSLRDSCDVNVNGQILLCRAALPLLRVRRGCIVNIGSMRSLDCPHFPLYPPSMGDQPINYTTEKWAMVGMTKYLAGRYGPDGVRVNCVCPGGYNPALAESADTRAFVRAYEENCPLGRFANEDDIKGPVAFLASDAAAYITGATLVMDGGWTIW